MVDAPGTDCGTRKGIRGKFTEEYFDLFEYQNIQKDDGTLVNINRDTYKQFLGKNVVIRTPMYCINDKCCSACAGKKFELLNFENVGLTAPRITNNLVNASMKNFHITKIQLDEVDIDTLIIE